MLRRLLTTPEKEPRGRRAPDGTVVFAIGDIHGRADLLELLHDKIAAYAGFRPEPRRVIVYLGDYVDRGPDSRGVIDLLLAPRPDGFERVFLKGNHEDAMLRFLDEAGTGSDWLGFGGAATLDSYGVDPFRESGLEAMRLRLAERLPAAHRAFLEGLELWHEEGDYFFAHAGVRPGVPLDRQDEDDLMWIRGEFLNSDREFGKVVVHGHSIRDEPEVRANRIGIDTGAFATGVLTCLVAAGEERAFLQTA